MRVQWGETAPPREEPHSISKYSLATRRLKRKIPRRDEETQRNEETQIETLSEPKKMFCLLLQKSHPRP